MVDLSRPDVGLLIRKARERLGITQDELAKLANIRPATLSAVENGGDARMSTLRAIRAQLVSARDKARES